MNKYFKVFLLSFLILFLVSCGKDTSDKNFSIVDVKEYRKPDRIDYSVNVVSEEKLSSDEIGAVLEEAYTDASKLTSVINNGKNGIAIFLQDNEKFVGQGYSLGMYSVEEGKDPYIDVKNKDWEKQPTDEDIDIYFLIFDELNIGLEEDEAMEKVANKLNMSKQDIISVFEKVNLWLAY